MDYNASKFDAPIPGQSLTTEPGNAQYEKPPQYTSIEEAMESIWNGLTNPSNAKRLGMVLSEGMPAESMARGILFAGFTENKWTPDMSLALAEPTLMAVVAVAEKMKIKNLKIMNPRNKDDVLDRYFDLASSKVGPEDMPMEEEIEVAVEAEEVEDDLTGSPLAGEIESSPSGLNLMGV